MHYYEHPVPSSLHGLVAAIWTLDCNGDADEWQAHDATPDGCVELIHRTRGRSVWGVEQPAIFVAGIAETAAPLRFSGDAAFFAIRFWPWAWNMIARSRCHDFTGGWQAIGDDDPIANLVKSPNTTNDALETLFGSKAISPIAGSVLSSAAVADLVDNSGQSPRTVQRWFANEIGIPARRYLRLLRFRTALAELGQNDTSLAHHAADTGYADQAHMARDFRMLAGTAASKARRKAKGPFLPK